MFHRMKTAKWIKPDKRTKLEPKQEEMLPTMLLFLRKCPDAMKLLHQSLPLYQMLVTILLLLNLR